MDEQKKADARKPVSREAMLAYLYRHKLKKKYRPIRPHTYANSFGLSTRQLQKSPLVNLKKPIINKNVKARLEGDLQYLLDNQSVNVARVKNPESYISLYVNRPKQSDKSTSTITSVQAESDWSSSAVHARKSTSPASSLLSLKSVTRHNAERFMPPPTLPSKSRKIGKINQKKQPHEVLSFERLPISKQTPPLASNRSSRSNSFHHIDDADSFNFHNIENQNRADHRFASYTSSKSGKKDKGKHRPEKHLYSRVHTSPSATSHRSTRPLSFDFDPSQTQNQHVPPSSIDPDPSFGFEFQQPRCHSESFENFQSKPPSHRSSKRTIQTRIVKSCVSRVGESPFMEQIVIQRMKHKH